jgi:hypothetical protein
VNAISKGGPTFNNSLKTLSLFLTKFNWHEEDSFSCIYHGPDGPGKPTDMGEDGAQGSGGGGRNAPQSQGKTND